MQCASNIHVVIQYSHSAVFSPAGYEIYPQMLQLSLVYLLTFAVFFQYLPCRSFPQVCYTFPDLLSQENKSIVNVLMM